MIVLHVHPDAFTDEALFSGLAYELLDEVYTEMMFLGDVGRVIEKGPELIENLPGLLSEAAEHGQATEIRIVIDPGLPPGAVVATPHKGWVVH